jgi:RNA polymerase sigma factor (sigma-70 family)
MLNDEEFLSQGSCLFLTEQYLQGQGWALVDPAEMAAEIWRELAGQGLQGTTAVNAVNTGIWLRYAGCLYHLCRQPGATGYPAAWGELRSWLLRQSGQVTSDNQRQEELVQEVLITLSDRLTTVTLQAPRAFWAYSLQILRNKHIDLHRRAKAVKRGDDSVLSLEEMHDENDWQETLAANQEASRESEDIVADAEIRQQLKALFQQHLGSELQRQVAEAHFLDGLSPVEIGALMGKPAHEIRLVKARVVNTLRHLPTAASRQLDTILGPLEKEDANGS